MPISVVVGKLAEKLAEEHGKEAARWILSELQKHAVPIVTDLIGTYVPDILGAGEELVKEGGQWVLSELQKHAGPIVADLTAKYGLDIVGQSAEGLLQAVFPGIDEIPGEVLDRVSETKLAEIGRTTLDHLSAQARSKIKKAGYTSTQIGAAVITHFVDVVMRLEDVADGDSETARWLKDKLT